jgi:ABC-type sugar transport system ATPase subunit
MIRVDQLTVRAGAFALREIAFEVQTGQHAFLMGKTGTGKTTLVEALCGLRRCEGGTIHLMGQEVTAWPPAQRGIGLVPQDAALFPHLTVRGHLSFALEIRKWPRERIETRVKELAASLELGPLLERRPQGLSGGEAQRVALGRALAFHPGVLCLDEPHSALDEETRAEMGDLLRRVRAETGVTILHITHNRSEAERLADRVLWLRDGAIREE